MKSYLKQDNIAPTQHYLFELDFKVKYPLLRLLQFPSDLKSTIYIIENHLRNKLFQFKHEIGIIN